MGVNVGRIGTTHAIYLSLLQCHHQTHQANEMEASESNHIATTDTFSHKSEIKSKVVYLYYWRIESRNTNKEMS